MENQNQNLLQEIEAYLKSRDFIKDSDVLFKLQRVIRQPGPKMVVNGQPVKMPDQELIHTITVEFFGPGFVDDRDQFEIIRFHIEDMETGSKSVQETGHMEGFYPGELERFKQILDKLL